jgi:hypothetical protein
MNVDELPKGVNVEDFIKTSVTGLNLPSFFELSGLSGKLKLEFNSLAIREYVQKIKKDLSLENLSEEDITKKVKSNLKESSNLKAFTTAISKLVSESKGMEKNEIVSNVNTSIKEHTRNVKKLNIGEKEIDILEDFLQELKSDPNKTLLEFVDKVLENPDSVRKRVLRKKELEQARNFTSGMSLDHRTPKKSFFGSLFGKKDEVKYQEVEALIKQALKDLEVNVKSTRTKLL